MTRQHTTSASPYEAQFGFARAVRVGNQIAVSGTAPIEPDGTVTPGGAEAQARRCFDIIEAAISQLGGSISDIVRTRMYITDISQYEAVAAEHGRRFATIRPAATIVEVSALIDPEMLVEIEADAIVAEAGG